MYLPDAHTDFVFGVTLDTSSYAIVAALALIAGIAFWIWLIGYPTCDQLTVPRVAASMGASGLPR
jgi:cell division protein FtsW (lipid II flippase)